MMVYWLYSLACTVEEPSLDRVSAVEDTIREHGLAVINHLQEKQATKQYFQSVQVWDGTDSEYGLLLSKLTGATLIQDVKDLDSTALLLTILEPNTVAMLPRHPNIVAVLRGDWTEKDKSPLSRRTIGFASIRASTQRYCVYSSASLETRVSSVALDIADHFKLDLQLSSLTPESLDIGLWGKINRKWLSKDAVDVRGRWDKAILDTDPLARLVQLQYGTQDDNTFKLLQDLDPWIRAQAVRTVDDLHLIEPLVLDESSLVRASAGHRLGELLRSSSSQHGCKIAEELTVSSDAYVRWKGAYALQFCPEGTNRLLSLFDDQDIDVQRQAVLSIQYHPTVNDHFDKINELTTRDNSFVRRWAWTTLSTMNHPSLQSSLYQCIANEVSSLARESCAIGLERLDQTVERPMYRPPMDKDVEDIDVVLNHPDPTFRKDAAKFLANRPKGEVALQKLMMDMDGEVRKTAVEALGFRQSSLVWEALTDVDPDVLVTALEAIRIGKIYGDVTQLEDLLRHSDTEIQLRSVEAWTTFPNQLTERQKGILKEILNSPDERIRAAIVGVFPTWISKQEPSMLVRMSAVSSDPMLASHWPTDLMVQLVAAGGNKRQWIKGIIQEQDDLVHELYSWNDPQDKPESHRALRPPRFAPYGHPNRG